MKFSRVIEADFHHVTRDRHLWAHVPSTVEAGDTVRVRDIFGEGTLEGVALSVSDGRAIIDVRHGAENFPIPTPELPKYEGCTFGEVVQPFADHSEEDWEDVVIRWDLEPLGVPGLLDMDSESWTLSGEAMTDHTPSMHHEHKDFTTEDPVVFRIETSSWHWGSCSCGWVGEFHYDVLCGGDHLHEADQDIHQHLAESV